MTMPEIDWDAVPYIHKDRHPSCCCTQCVSDEAEWEITCLRGYLAELEAKVLVMEEEIAAAWSVADIETNKVERLEDALRGVVDRWDATSGVVLSKDIGKAKAALEGEQ